MLVILLIGWTILLPAIVVAGLYIGSTVLGRRRAALHAYEDLLDEDAFLTDPGEQSAHVAPVTRLPPGRRADEPLAPARAHEPAIRSTARPAAGAAESSERRPVGARH